MGVKKTTKLAAETACIFLSVFAGIRLKQYSAAVNSLCKQAGYIETEKRYLSVPQFLVYLCVTTLAILDHTETSFSVLGFRSIIKRCTAHNISNHFALYNSFPIIHAILI